MFRKKLSRGRSNRSFRRGLRVKLRNHAAPMRGGFRI